MKQHLLALTIIATSAWAMEPVSFPEPRRNTHKDPSALDFAAIGFLAGSAGALRDILSDTAITESTASKLLALGALSTPTFLSRQNQLGNTIAFALGQLGGYTITMIGYWNSMQGARNSNEEPYYTYPRD